MEARTTSKRLAPLRRSGAMGPSRDQAAQLAVATGASLALAYAIAKLPDALVVLPGMAALVAIAWRPWLAVAAAAVAVTVDGREAAYWGIGAVGVPLFEPLLALASAVVIVHLLAKPSRHDSLRLGSALPWLPACVWGLVLIVGRNSGDTLSGVREAMLFVYPLLIALPLATVPPPAVRGALVKGGALVVAVGWYLMIEGISNLLQHKGGVTNSGQLRALGSFAGPALVASMLIGIWNLQQGRWSTRTAVVASAPVAGLLAVNHRSGYLAFIVAVVVLWLMRGDPRKRADPRVRRFATVAATVLGVVLVATPVGSQGVQRFDSLFKRDDANIRARSSDTRSALSLHGADVVIGKGVGLEKTALNPADAATPELSGRQGIHDSFAATVYRGGLIGFSLLMGALAWACWCMWRRRDDAAMQVILPLSAYSLTFAAFNVVMENLYLGLWVWLPVVLGLKLARE